MRNVRERSTNTKGIRVKEKVEYAVMEEEMKDIYTRRKQRI
jgi:hypothetical protein